MKRGIDDEFLSNIMKEFDSRYPNYVGELRVYNPVDEHLLFHFRNTGYPTTLSELSQIVPFGTSADEGVWMNIVSLLDNIVETYEREAGEEGCENDLALLKHSIKLRLRNISEAANIDMDTLWTYFEDTMADLKEECFMSIS